MALTDQQYQDLIAAELGSEDDTKFLRVLSLRWRDFADQPAIDPRLQLLMTKRAMVDYLISANYQKVNWRSAAGTRQDDSDRVKNLKFLRDDLTLLIEAIQAAFPPQIGALTQVEPVMPTDPVVEYIPPDPGDRGYRGDPLKRTQVF